MGLFSKNHLKASEEVYDKEVIPNLVPRDGFQHIIMIASFSKSDNYNFGVDNKYTTQLNYIITRMQKEGYEIIAVTHSTLQNQGIGGIAEGFHTLVTYK